MLVQCIWVKIKMGILKENVRKFFYGSWEEWGIFLLKNKYYKKIIFFFSKYYVMNYSINSFTGASEAPVNVVVVY